MVDKSIYEHKVSVLVTAVQKKKEMQRARLHFEAQSLQDYWGRYH